MALDELDTRRKKAKDKYRKLTKSEIAKLSPTQKKRYDEAVENQNIVVTTKGDKKFSGTRFTEIDSETYLPVKKPIMNTAKARQKARVKANEYKTSDTSKKGYSTELNMPIPKSKPKISPKEKLDYRVGGMVKSMSDNRKK
tara:strand:- start:38 stop:460 length:423 start_codon:yes stop_codon:yes gene_type:complete